MATKQRDKIIQNIDNLELEDETADAMKKDVEDFYDGFMSLEEMDEKKMIMLKSSDTTVEIESIKEQNKTELDKYRDEKRKELKAKYEKSYKNVEKMTRETARGTEGIIDSPERLWEYAVEYFIYCDTYTTVASTNKGIMYEKLQPLPKTIKGLADFIGVTDRWLQRLAKNLQYEKVYAMIKQATEMSSFVLGSTGQIDPKMAQLNLMVNYGWVETKQIDVNVNAKHTIEELTRKSVENKLGDEDLIEDVEYIDVTDIEDDDDEE